MDSDIKLTKLTKYNKYLILWYYQIHDSVQFMNNPYNNIGANKTLLKFEVKWIHKLNTVYPHGLNLELSIFILKSFCCMADAFKTSLDSCK